MNPYPDLFNDINRKVRTARGNVRTAYIERMRVRNSGLKDEGFYAVTNIIISLMVQIKDAANHVEERLPILQSPNTNPNFRRDLTAIQLTADSALAISELALEQMKIAVADAEDWK